MDINLRVTPSELKNQSDQVMRDIDQIEKSWREIEKLITGSKEYWQGNASDTHIRSYKDIADDVNRLIGRLKDSPINLQKMAGVYEQAEQASKLMAEALPQDVLQ